MKIQSKNFRRVPSGILLGNPSGFHTEGFKVKIKKNSKYFWDSSDYFSRSFFFSGIPPQVPCEVLAEVSTAILAGALLEIPLGVLSEIHPLTSFQNFARVYAGIIFGNFSGFPAGYPAEDAFENP